MIAACKKIHLCDAREAMIRRNKKQAMHAWEGRFSCAHVQRKLQVTAAYVHMHAHFQAFLEEKELLS